MSESFSFHGSSDRIESGAIIQSLQELKALELKALEKNQRDGLKSKGVRKKMKWKSFSDFHVKPTLCELKGDHKRNVKKHCGPLYGALF